MVRPIIMSIVMFSDWIAFKLFSKILPNKIIICLNLVQSVCVCCIFAGNVKRRRGLE